MKSTPYNISIEKRKSIRDEFVKAFKILEGTVEPYKMKHFKYLEKIIDVFIKQKGHLLEYFNEKLRIEIKTKEDEETLKRLDIETVFKIWENQKASNLVNNSDRYSYEGLNYYKLVDWMRDKMLKFTNEEIQKGRILEKFESGYIDKTYNENSKMSKYLMDEFDYEIEKKYDDGFDLYDVVYDCHDSDEKIPLARDLMLDFYSQIISSLKYKEANFVLSINPIDFLLMSKCNKGDWTSCQRYTNGEYKTAWLSYLMDETTLISYAYEDTVVYKNGSYAESTPKKLWRQLVYIDEYQRVAMFGRQYPEPNPLYAKYARKLTGRLMADFLDIERAWIFGTYSNISQSSTLKQNENFEKINQEESELSRPSERNEWHYQDDAETIIKMKDGGALKNRIRTGSYELICPVCGKFRKDSYSGGHICQRCMDSIVTCSSCGKHIPKEDAIKDDDSYHEFYCQKCFKEKSTECDICGKKVIKKTMEIYSVDGEVIKSCQSLECIEKIKDKYLNKEDRLEISGKIVLDKEIAQKYGLGTGMTIEDDKEEDEREVVTNVQTPF